MGRIVAIGGGDLQTTRGINHSMVKLSKKEHPNVLFIGTASEDDEGYIAGIKAAFQGLDCEVKALCLVKHQCSEQEMDAALTWADIIYVGGGDTAFMIKKWRACGLDKKLLEIYKNDSAVLGGLSAGAMCWFYSGHSDSESIVKREGCQFGFVDGMLDIHHYAVCPHYNEEGRNSFDEMLEGKNLVGLALENEVAFVEENGVTSFICSREGARGYRITYKDNVMDKEELPVLSC